MGRRRVIVGLLGVCVVATALATAALGRARPGASAPPRLQTAASAIDPQVAAGAHYFVQFACSACHGEQGRGGVSPYVPALKPIGRNLTVKALSTIITQGLGESKNPKKPYMPVWGAVISRAQVADLVAYVRAGLPKVTYTAPVPIPRDQGDVVAGLAAYQHYGCINCHGPNGLGGVPNPQSPDKTIPPLSGQDFRKEFDTDAKILAVIRAGSVIGRQPIASMPHWGGIIPNWQLRALLAYLKTLK